ncbi:putative bacterial extracellular solute-binding protein [Candidatus Vecturithrix granuli]|uniref:Putative bacterial extracellular solute-binding protein n=1 Tax=Vecturithrix granuli TaxID=1499967 RepID=A0A081C4Q3_VECG1|nr:putative bacterial extracellular solute-binding protein [Candidatus Vecturithrix granuli]
MSNSFRSDEPKEHTFTDVGKVRYTPLYLQVKDVLLKRITNNVYQRGEAIPSEATLAREFGASVSTIRQALALLAADGVLVKKQGKGTYVSEQKTTLRFFSWMSEKEPGKAILLRTIERFEQKYPMCVIEILPNSFQTAKEDLVHLIASGNAPDIVQIMTHWTSYFAAMGALECLDGLLSQENVNSRFYEQDLYGGLFQNKLYSVSWGLGPFALIANKNMLREVGVTFLDSPMTLDVFWAVCQQIDQFYQEKEKYSYALSRSSDKEADFLMLYGFLQAFHGGFTNEAGDIIFDSTANVAAFTWLREFVKNCRIFTSDLHTIRERFAHNDIAFISDGPWIKYVMENLTGREFEQDFTVVLNPVHGDTPSFSWNCNLGLAICSQSPYKAYSAKFIEALTHDPEIVRDFSWRTGILPARKHELDTPDYHTEFFEPYTQQLEHAVCINAQHAMFTKAMHFCADAARRILYEQVDIGQELREKTYYLNLLYH